jgi:2-polyprenyl-3-methyl-5-hydroxy-6-metoxy-1,4-benzoquinol methylase
VTTGPEPTGEPEPAVRFDELAELFRIFAADTDRIYRDFVSAAVPDLSARPGSRAVDLGCGSGRFTDLLAARNGEVLGVDIARRELEMARAEHPQPHVAFDQRSLLDVTPVADGRFDLVFSVNTVHHLSAHQVVLPHLRTLVAPGRYLVVIDIINPGGWDAGRDWHVRAAFAAALESYLDRSRDLDTAVAVLRLMLHPAWLDHVTTNIPLTLIEFVNHYGAAFPGARFTQLSPVVAAVQWRAPD